MGHQDFNLHTEDNTLEEMVEEVSPVVNRRKSPQKIQMRSHSSSKQEDAVFSAFSTLRQKNFNSGSNFVTKIFKEDQKD